MKKKYNLWPLLLVIPFFLLLVHGYFVKTIDNYRNNINTDPDYAYLLSSIDISNLKNSLMVVHPGTTVQIMSHFIMKCTHWVSRDSKNFQTAILKNPAFYLNVLNNIFALINIGLVFFLGFFTYIITKQIFSGFLIQLTPLLSSQTIIFGFRRITADVVLVFISILMILVPVKILHTDTIKIRNKSIYFYAIILGLISGFGIATKVPFIPLLMIPLILLPFLKPRLIYCVSTTMSFFIFTMPIFSHYAKIVDFLKNIITHKGIYGHGRLSIFNPNDYIFNLLRLSKENIPFVILLIISIFFIFIVLKSPGKRNAVKKDLTFKLLMAVTTSQILSVIMVARHFKSKYLLSAFCLSGLLLYLLYNHISQQYPNKFSIHWKKKEYSDLPKIIMIVFCLGSLLFTYKQVAEYHHHRSEKLVESRAIEKEVENKFKDFGKIYFYNASSVIHGLQFGHRWTPIFEKKLRELYQDQYFYQHYQRFIYNWDIRNRISLKTIQEKYNNRVIFIGTPFKKIRKTIKKPPFALEDVFKGKQLTIYRLIEN